MLLVAGASLLSVPLFMAGTPDGRIGWVTTMWLLYFACGLAVGTRLHRWWFVAAGVAWFPLLLLPEYIGYVERPGATRVRLMFMLSPVAPLLGALLASQLAKKWSSVGTGDAA